MLWYKLLVNIIVIIPEFNEGQRLIDTVTKVLNCTKNKIIIVDDGSKYSSYKKIYLELRRNKRITILRHLINLGKGAAMKTGVEAAWDLGAEAVIFIDADGQHNPEHLKKFEEKLTINKIVFGCRSMDKKIPWVRKWGNIVASNLVRVLFNIKRKDLLSGYLGFRKSVYPLIEWKSPRYGIETEIATKIGKKHLSFSEIKIDTIYIDKYKGVSILDALKILIQIPFWYFEK